MAAVKQHPVASAAIPGSNDLAVEKAKVRRAYKQPLMISKQRPFNLPQLAQKPPPFFVCAAERNRAALIGVRNASKQVVRSAKVVKEEEEEGEAAGQQGPGECVAGHAQGNGQMHTAPDCNSGGDGAQGTGVVVCPGMAEQRGKAGLTGSQGCGEPGGDKDGPGSSRSIHEGKTADGLNRAGVQVEEGAIGSETGSDEDESEGSDGDGALGSSGAPMDKEARKVSKEGVLL
eukprot:scaffold257852_cov19-Tisochrysis_lutea.AAC.1